MVILSIIYWSKHCANNTLDENSNPNDHCSSQKYRNIINSSCKMICSIDLT